MTGEWLAEIALKSFFLITIAAALTAQRRGSAAWRHWVWALTLLCLLALPLTSALAPTWELAILPSHRPPVLEPLGERLTDRGAAATTIQQGPAAATAATVTESAAFTGARALWWPAGTVLALLWLLRDRLRVAALAGHRARRAPKWVRRRTDVLARQLGVQRRIRVRVSAATRAPLAWGQLRPVILLPAAAEKWDPERLRIVLLHELAHVQRRDYFWIVLSQCVRALYWWNPAVWWATRRLVTESESACDDIVLGCGVKSLDYAQQLLEICRSITVPRLLTASAITYGQLRRRLEAVLDERRSRRRVGHRLAGVSLLLALSLTAAVTSLKLTAAAAPSPPAGRPVAMTVAEALRLVGSPDLHDRMAAAWVLGERETRAGTRAMIGLLEDPQPEVRATAAWALGEIKDPAALGLLLGRRHETDRLAREALVRAVGEFESRKALPFLESALADADPDVRQAAVWALGEIRPRVPAEFISRALKDASAGVRGMAVTVLASRFHNLNDLLPLLTGDPSPRVRQTVAGVLGDRGGADSIGALLLALRDSDEQVRAAAARALGRIGDSRAVTGLIASLRDPSAQVRWTATWALDEISQ